MSAPLVDREGRPVPDAPPHGRPWVYWTATAAGWAVIGYGVWGLFADADATRPADWARWFVGSLVAHDAVLAPVVFAVGMVVARVVRGPLRRPVRAGLILSGLVGLVAFPLLRGYGVRADNPTLHPRDYGPGVVALLVAIWVVVAVWALVARRRASGGPADA